MTNKIKISEVVNKIENYKKLPYSDKLNFFYTLIDKDKNLLFKREFNLLMDYYIDNIKIEYDINVDDLKNNYFYFNIQPENSIEINLYINWLLDTMYTIKSPYSIKLIQEHIYNENNNSIEFLEDKKIEYFEKYIYLKNNPNIREFIEKGFMYAEKNYQINKIGKIPFSFKEFYIGYQYGCVIKYIDKLINEIENPNETKEPLLPSILPNKKNQKVMLLFELGIFDKINELLPNNLKDNETKIAQIIESFTDLDQDTIRQNYRSITGKRYDKNPYDVAANVNFVVNSFNTFGLKRTKK